MIYDSGDFCGRGGISWNPQRLNGGGRGVRVSIMTRGLLLGLLSGAVAAVTVLWPRDNAEGWGTVSVHRLVKDGPHVTSLAFAPDARTLAVGNAAGNLQLWNVATFRRRAEVQTRSGIASLAFSPDGRSLAAAVYGPEIFRWDALTLEELPSFTAPGAWFAALKYSPDGRTLAAADASGMLTLWDVVAGRIRTVLEGHEGMALTLAFSHDGQTLASGGGQDGAIILWDTARGRRVNVLPAQPSSLVNFSMSHVVSLAFSPDDRTLASGYEHDPHLRLWDVASGQHIEAWKGEAWCTSIPLIAFGQGAASLSVDGATGRTRIHQRRDPGKPPLLAAFCSLRMRIASSDDLQMLAIAGVGDVDLWTPFPPPGETERR
jgi:WD40 repeat protein